MLPPITFFFRHPRPEYHSLERLFSRLGEYLKQKAGRQIISPIQCPYSRVTPLNLLRNCFHARRNQGRINHITGDVHYLALALPKRSTILTIPDCVLLNRTSKRSVRYAVFWLLWYYLPIRRATIVTAISEKTRRELYQYVGQLADKVFVVPCHYDPRFTYSPKAFNNIYPTILHIGTAPHKNLGRLICAIAGLTCRLVIVGQLSDAEQGLLITHQIDYKNYINTSQDEIIMLYKQCDIVSFISLYEGFGLPIIEGQVVGRPVITSAISPMNDVGGNGACYVDPTDIAAIRSGIERILTDEAYRTSLQLNGQANAGMYSIERIANQYVGLYNSLQV